MRLRVITHSGHMLELTVDSFNAVEFNQQLNNNEIQTVELGGTIISRFEVKIITPIENTNDGQNNQEPNTAFEDGIEESAQDDTNEKTENDPESQPVDIS